MLKLKNIILFFVLLLTISSIKAQYIKAGLRFNYINYNLASNNNSVNINFSNLNNSSIIINDIEKTNLNILFAPELFIKYDFKNYLFIELSSQYNSATIYYNSIISEEYLDKNNNIVKKEDNNIIESDLKLITPSIKIGFRLLKTKLIRPTLFAGISMPIKLDYKVNENTILLLPESYDIVNNSLNTLNKTYYAYKAGIEFQVYNFMFGALVSKNISDINNSGLYYNSFSTIEIYFAYNFINLSTVKKQNE